MESLSMQLRFLDFDELPEDEVQSIRNMLNCPCSAVQLPVGVNFRPADADSYAANEHDHYSQLSAEPHSDGTVNYGLPVVTMVSPYPTHIQQAPIYPMANGNFLANTNHIQHLLFVPDMIDGMPDGSTSSLKSGMDAGCSSNGPNSGVVVSNPYHHHIGMFHCPAPSHHTPQYVMSHVHPAAYISTYLPQPPPSAVCKSTMAAAAGLSMPTAVGTANFVNRPVPIPSLLPMPMSAPPCPSLEMTDPASPGRQGSGELNGDVEEACLEHVVVEVPPVFHPPVSSAPRLDAVTTASHERRPRDTSIRDDEFSFMCEDQLKTSGPETIVVERSNKVESEHVDDDATKEIPPPSDDILKVAEVNESHPVEPTVTVDAVACRPAEGSSQKRKCPRKRVKEPVLESPSQTKSWASLFKSNASMFPLVESPKNNLAPATASVKSMHSPQTNTAAKPVSEKVAQSSDQLTSQGSLVSTKPDENPFKRNNKRRETSSRRKDVSNSNGIVNENSLDPSRLGNILSSAVLDNRHTSYMIRGLYNSGNWCYINSILQALLVCDPLYNLLDSLKACRALGQMKTSSPIIDSMVEFVTEYSVTPEHKTSEESSKSANKRTGASGLIGQPLDPTCVYDMLTHLKLNAFEGRQEDAEEFLSCLLNGLHDEMAKAMSYSSTSSAATAVKICVENSFLPNGNTDKNAENDSADEESWKVIEPRNKCSITRSTSFSSSPLSDIFCGRMRSAVLASSTSSATLQPFFTLQLDVQAESVKTVAEALHCFVMKESLQDYHCAKTKQEIVASRQITLEELPPVLILHLKRFVYCKDGGCMKVSKRVDFDVNLHFHKELLSPAARTKISQKQRNYKLAAVVYHCGNEAAKGHYITDVCNESGDIWFRTDDSRVTCVWQSAVLNHPKDFVPYLLFYRRMDTVRVLQQPKDLASAK